MSSGNRLFAVTPVASYSKLGAKRAVNNAPTVLAQIGAGIVVASLIVDIGWALLKRSRP